MFYIICVACGSSYDKSVVLVYQYYETYYTFTDNYTTNLSVSNKFIGTLINRYTVLTSADSFINEFQHTYNGVTYTIPVKRNENFTTWGSMFQVVVGVQDLSLLTIDSNNIRVNSPGVVLKIVAAKQVSVCCRYQCLIIICFYYVYDSSICHMIKQLVEIT